MCQQSRRRQRLLSGASASISYYSVVPTVVMAIINNKHCLTFDNTGWFWWPINVRSWPTDRHSVVGLRMCPPRLSRCLHKSISFHGMDCSERLAQYRWPSILPYHRFLPFCDLIYWPKTNLFPLTLVHSFIWLGFFSLLLKQFSHPATLTLLLLFIDHCSFCAFNTNGEKTWKRDYRGLQWRVRALSTSVKSRLDLLLFLLITNDRIKQHPLLMRCILRRRLFVCLFFVFKFLSINPLAKFAQVSLRKIAVWNR